MLVVAAGLLLCAVADGTGGGTALDDDRGRDDDGRRRRPADTLRDVAIQIEQFRAVVGGLIPDAGRPPSLPTAVFVFSTRKAMLPFVPLANGKPAQVAGFFQRSGDMNHIVMTLEGFEESAAIVYHEYTHLLLANAVRSIPVWLNEGLAEYYSSYKLSADRRSAEIGGILDWRLALLRDRFLPLSQIIAVDSVDGAARRDRAALHFLRRVMGAHPLSAVAGAGRRRQAEPIRDDDCGRARTVRGVP